MKYEAGKTTWSEGRRGGPGGTRGSRLEGSFASGIPWQDTSEESAGAMAALHHSYERSDDVICLWDVLKVVLSRGVDEN